MADCCTSFIAYGCTVDGYPMSRVGFSETCLDCTVPTPCCGYQSCNIFCCNCECRKQWNCEQFMGCVLDKGRRKRSLRNDFAQMEYELEIDPDIGAYTIFNSVDTNSDGRLDLDEVKTWTKLRNVTFSNNEFRAMDVSGDGYLQLGEIDDVNDD